MSLDKLAFSHNLFSIFLRSLRNVCFKCDSDLPQGWQSMRDGARGKIPRAVDNDDDE